MCLRHLAALFLSLGSGDVCKCNLGASRICPDSNYLSLPIPIGPGTGGGGPCVHLNRTAHHRYAATQSNQPDYSWKGQSVTGQCDKLVFSNFYIDIINIPDGNGQKSRQPYSGSFKLMNLWRHYYKINGHLNIGLSPQRWLLRVFNNHIASW